MTKLMWDEIRPYEFGLDRGVYYPANGVGKSWSGLISVSENTVDSERKVRYLDGIKIQENASRGFFEGSIKAYAYPGSFYDDVLTQTRLKDFGLSYRVQSDRGYKIHLIYNVLIGPTDFLYHQTEIEFFQWNFTTRPVDVPDAARTSHIIIDTSIAHPWTVSEFENIIYGSETVEPRLPLPFEVLDIFETNSILRVIDNGDGSFTVIGPDEAIVMLDPTTFEITWPSAVFIDAVSYKLSSL